MVKSFMKLDMLDGDYLPSHSRGPNIYSYSRHPFDIHGVFNKFPDFFVQAFTIVVDP